MSAMKKNLAIVLLFTQSTFCEAARTTEFSGGHPSCPCLLPSAVPPVGHAGSNTKSLDLKGYGIGCGPHDLFTEPCTPKVNCAAVSPLPIECNRPWCSDHWCFVDPQNCSLQATESFYFPESGRYYSYATCGYMDKFVNEERLKLLKGETFKVGYVKNTGGYTGSYSNDGRRYGVLPDFFNEAAKEAGFTMLSVELPSSLRENAERFFSSSNFDLCVYAATLGYLDFCIGQFTYSDKRVAAATSWWIVEQKPLYLITFDESTTKSWDSFFQNVRNVFLPFTRDTWFLIILAIPSLGLLIWWHEDQLIRKEGTSWSRFFREQIMACVDMGFRSFLEQAYLGEGHTFGGRLTIFGIGFLFVAVGCTYQANLATILWNNSQVSQPVKSIEEAIQAGYTFCGERKNVAEVIKRYKMKNLILADPESEGGDGEAGFNCEECEARRRVFDYMKKDPDGSSLYCNAAIADKEDLEALQSEKLHCNKTAVGEPLVHIDYGIPLFQKKSKELIYIFQKLKNQGVLHEKASRAQPMPQCRKSTKDNENLSLNPVQLSGIWVISSLFAIGGLLPTLVMILVPKKWKQEKRENGEKNRPINIHKRRKKQPLSAVSLDPTARPCGRELWHPPLSLNNSDVDFGGEDFYECITSQRTLSTVSLT